MTVEEAEQVGHLLKSIKSFESLPDRIIKLHKEGKHNEVANMACELSSELLRIYKDKLHEYPSKVIKS